MKKAVLWFFIIILVLSLGLNAFLIIKISKGSNLHNYQTGSSEVDSMCFVGAYYTDSWNGKSQTCILLEDGTGFYPGEQSMIWSYKDGCLHFYLKTGTSSEHIAYPADNGFSLHGAPFFRF